MKVYSVVTGRADGPAVVLSNSLGSTHRMWDGQLADLEQRFRVIRYDTRGHGDSPVPLGPYGIDDLADDLVALLDRLEVERAHIEKTLRFHEGNRTRAAHELGISRATLINKIKVYGLDI